MNMLHSGQKSFSLSQSPHTLLAGPNKTGEKPLKPPGVNATSNTARICLAPSISVAEIVSTEGAPHKHIRVTLSLSALVMVVVMRHLAGSAPTRASVLRSAVHARTVPSHTAQVISSGIAWEGGEVRDGKSTRRGPFIVMMHNLPAAIGIPWVETGIRLRFLPPSSSSATASS